MPLLHRNAVPVVARGGVRDRHLSAAAAIRPFHAMRWILVLAAAYAVAGRFGQLIAIPPGNVTAVWFPSGIAVAAVLLYGRRLWPGVWLGSFVVNTWAFFDPATTTSTMSSMVVGSLIAVGATLQAIAGAFLARTSIGSKHLFDSDKSVFKFAVLAGGIACLISATTGVTSLAAGGFLDWADYQHTWITWWLGDATGVVVGVPLLLLWHANRRGWTRRQSAELALMLALIVTVAILAFGGWAAATPSRLVLQYSVIPLLVWPAVRFGKRETVSAAFILAIVATLCYAKNLDAAPADDTHLQVLGLQGLIGIVTVTTLALAADIGHRVRTMEKLRKYKLASHSTADHWMITDLDGTILEVNQSFLDLTGYARDEVLGSKPDFLDSGVHDRAFFEDMWRTITAGETYRGLIVNRKKNGELYNELRTITPIRDDKGKLERFLSIGKDITEIVRNEEKLVMTARDLEQANRRLRASDQALARQVEILQSVFRHMKEGVVVADTEGRFVMFNEAAERMIGTGATDSGPAEWTRVYGVYRIDGETPFPTEELPLVRAISGESTDSVEMVVRNANNRKGSWLRVSGSPILDEEGDPSGGLIVMREVSAEKRAEKAEEELQVTRAEFAVARRIQQQFLPRSSPAIAGFDISGASRSATATGGDYFDFVPMPDGSLLLLVGDVSGHGLGPALLMASVRGHLRALVETGLPLSDILAITNRMIREEMGTESFVTLFAAHLDPASASINYISAGHTTAYVLGQDGVVKETMRSSYVPLGVLPEFSADPRSAGQLTVGDTVLILTDGVVEAERRDGSFYGDTRAVDVVRRNGHKMSSDVVHALFADLNEWRGCSEFEDDITAVVIRRVTH